MARKDKKPSSAPWVLAAGAGLVFAASGVTGSGSGVAASAAESKPSGSGAVVAQAAKDAGFTGNDLVIAIAVSKAESDWRPKARNGNTNGTLDCGLFQINSVHKQLLKKHDCYDPKANAQMARAVWKQSNGSWSPWVTYQRGKHLAFITEARSLAAGVR
jgi:Lysozyme like domain